MNAVTITIRDRSKTATCRETLSMCGQYEVTVEPAWTGPGFLVLHDRIDLPRVWPKCPDTCWAAPLMEEGGVFTYAKLVDGASEKDGQGVPTEDGLLDLRDKELVRKLSKFTSLGGVNAVPYSVYAENGSGGMNMIGTGYMQILVAEPYSSKNGKDLSLFKGEKGDPAPRVQSIEKKDEDADGNWIYTMTLSDGTQFTFISPKGPRGNDALTTYVKEELEDKYHMLRVRQAESGEYVLLVEKEAASADKTFDEATIEANESMRKAGWYAIGRFSDDDPPVLLVAGAKQYAEAASGSAAAASGSAQNAANSATSAAGHKEAAVLASSQAKTYRDEALGARDAAVAAKEQTIAAKNAAIDAIGDAKDEAVEEIDGKIANIADAMREAGAVLAGDDNTFEGDNTFTGDTSFGTDEISASVSVFGSLRVSNGIRGPGQTVFSSRVDVTTTAQTETILGLEPNTFYAVLCFVSKTGSAAATFYLDGTAQFSQLRNSMHGTCCRVKKASEAGQISFTHKTSVSDTTYLNFLVIQI